MNVFTRRKSFTIRAENVGYYVIDAFTKSQGKKELRKFRIGNGYAIVANGIGERLLEVRLF